MRIDIINGPNLNLLGTRNKEVYGDISFEKYLHTLNTQFNNVVLKHHQSNIEGEIINFLHHSDAKGIIINAGAYTHTSIAIADAIEAIKIPVIEVHISNVFKREKFRQTSTISKNCIGTISGFGLYSYQLAIGYFQKNLS